MPDVRDRQIDRRQTNRQTLDVRQHHRLMPSPIKGGGIIILQTGRLTGVERNLLLMSEFSRGKIFGSGRLCSHAAMKFDAITDPGE